MTEFEDRRLAKARQRVGSAAADHLGVTVEDLEEITGSAPADDPPKPAAAEKRDPSTARDDWAVPVAACSCGRTMVAEAYLDLDGWYVSLVCPDEGIDCSESQELPWPFREDRAAASDFRALGILVA